MVDQTDVEAVVVVGNGDLEAGLGDFERALDAALSARPGRLVLDLVAVERVSSMTVAMLLWARRRCLRQRTDIVLVHVSPRCRQTLACMSLVEPVEAGTREGERALTIARVVPADRS